MIKESILNEFISSDSDPAYDIIIKEITPSTKCNQESLTLIVDKINKVSGEKVLTRTLEIVSDVTYDSDGIPISKINGYKKKDIIATEDSPVEDVSSHYIEMIQTPLQESIEIEFNQEYDNKPGIIVNIDSKYESLYKSKSIDYLKRKINTDSEEESDISVYYGAIIKFNGLKRRGKYPDIKIILIGDKKDA